MNLSIQSKRKLPLSECILFAILGGLMFVSKLLLEFLPNIHPLAMLTMVYTLAFRKKALIPIYLYVFLNGLYAGFGLWWVPYLYLWGFLWGVTMLLPKKMPKRIAAVVYPAVCALHGLLFGILYAPAEALLFHLDFRATVAWVVSGLPWDCVHAAGNFLMGLLICPLSELLRKLLSKFSVGCS